MTWTEVGEKSGAWVCEYYAHTFGIPANAMAFRLAGEDLAIISPPTDSDEVSFREIENLGRVSAIVATSDYHNLGLAAWRAQYPDAGVFAPQIALPFLARRGHAGLAPLAALPAPSEVVFREVPGTKRGGTHVISTRGHRPVVYLDELIVNLAALPDRQPFKTLFWITRGAPGVRLNRMYAKMVVKNSRAVAAAARQALDGDPIIVPAHGAPLVASSDTARARDLVYAAAR